MTPPKPSTRHRRFALDSVVPWGRSFGEYRRMFALSDADLAGRLLDCGSGPASFAAEAAERGMEVVAADPLYRLGAAEIERAVEGRAEEMVAKLRAGADAFVWGGSPETASPEALGAHRLATLRVFLADYGRPLHRGRYVAAALPELPFGADGFDLALVSHLLFLYGGRLDADFHRAAIRALLSVAREVRVFPLLRLDGTPSPLVAPLADELAAAGYAAARVPVPYEVQRGGTEMLRIARRCREGEEWSG